MSVRPIKRVSRPQPTMEGAGVKLQRAFGFGKTKDFDPFLLLDDFQQRQPGRLCRRISLAPAPWHRDDNLCTRRLGRTRG